MKSSIPSLLVLFALCSSSPTSFAQGVYAVQEAPKHERYAPLRVVRRDFNTGVHGEHFSVLFGDLKGGAISVYQYKGGKLEYVETLGGGSVTGAVAEAAQATGDAAKAVATAATDASKEAMKDVADASKDAVKAGAEAVKDAADATKAAVEKK